MNQQLNVFQQFGRDFGYDISLEQSYQRPAVPSIRISTLSVAARSRIARTSHAIRWPNQWAVIPTGCTTSTLDRLKRGFAQGPSKYSHKNRTLRPVPLFVPLSALACLALPAKVKSAFGSIKSG